MDTTSFLVSGAYNSAGERVEEPGKSAEALEAETALIAITYGYSRDHREDLKQWLLALATTHEGDVPLFLQPLDGNSSDKVNLLAAVWPSRNNCARRRRSQACRWPITASTARRICGS